MSCGVVDDDPLPAAARAPVRVGDAVDYRARGPPGPVRVPPRSAHGRPPHADQAASSRLRNGGNGPQKPSCDGLGAALNLPESVTRTTDRVLLSGTVRLALPVGALVEADRGGAEPGGRSVPPAALLPVTIFAFRRDEPYPDRLDLDLPIGGDTPVEPGDTAEAWFQVALLENFPALGAIG